MRLEPAAARAWLARLLIFAAVLLAVEVPLTGPSGRPGCDTSTWLKAKAATSGMARPLALNHAAGGRASPCLLR